MRPIASCTVATPNRPSFSTAALSARSMLRLTMPSSVMLSTWVVALRVRSRTQHPVESRVDAAGIAFVDLVAVLRRYGRRLDVALRVVVIVTGFRIDAAYGA